MDFAFELDECERFVGARRWARAHRLPRLVFAKSPSEVKPVFVDLESPLFVTLLARLARGAHESRSGEATITLSEMLPDLEQAWLPDAAGEHYVSEIRFVVVDDERRAPARELVVM